MLICNFTVIYINLNMLYFPTLISVLEVLAVTVPVLLTVAYITVAERKTMASMQRRLGPNAVGWYGLLQAFADALKLLLKEYVAPTQANMFLFFLGPIITLIFSLLGYAVIPYGPGLMLMDYNLGILYILAMSSLATYGILLAGWSANSKYAFLGSKWPVKGVSLYLKQTISEKFRKQIILLTWIGTLCLTPFKWGSKVKILSKMNNPQVTKAFYSLVGTSEAICLLSILFFHYYKKRGKSDKGCIFYKIKVNHTTPTIRKDKKWNQWLAGLIDGGGSFHLTKKGYASLEITMDIKDEHALHIIKNVYGGSIKLVSGAKALRYYLQHKEGFLALVNDINGEIRNSYRLMQLNKICLKYEIALIYSDKLTYNNGWLSGFFDADGSVTLNSNNGQLAISLTQKTSEILQPLLDIYGGSIYIDRTSNNFKWYISDKEGIINLISYFKQYPPRSLKKNRLHLIPRCYELKEMGAHKALEETNPFLAKNWVIFKNKWDKYEAN